MYRMLLLLLICIAGPLCGQGDYTPEAANAEVAAGDHIRTAEILDSMERRGEVSTALYLALGNARFESGQPGRAILAYERGLRLQPAHRDLRNNLRFVREAAGITTPILPDFFLLRWWRVAGAWLGTATSFVIAAILWWLAVAGTVWWYLRRHRMEEKRRFALLPVALLFALLSGAFYLLGESRYTRLVAEDEAVLTTSASLRVAPTEEGSVEAQLEEGYKVTITDRVNRFVKVQLPDGRQGYVTLAEIEVI